MRMILLLLNRAYVLEPNTTEIRRGNGVKVMVSHTVRTRGDADPLTDDGNSTKNAQDCANSIPCIAAIDRRNVRPKA